MAPEITMFYPVVVHKDPDSDYGVSIPDLPGCISAGATLNEALEAAKDAIECHIEGMLIDGESVPIGGEVDRYRQDPEWTDGIWGLVQVGLSKLSGKSRHVNITLPERLLSQVNRFALSHGDTLSGFLAHAALEYMQQHQSDES